MPDTIWTLLLSGLVWFVRTLLLPLFGDSSSQAASMNFAKTIWDGTSVFIELISDTLGSVVNLTIFGIFLQILLAFFFMKVLISIYLSIKRLIPMVG